MFDYSTVKLLHRHGDDTWAPFAESGDHTSVAHDPERSWLKGAKLFKCTRCEDEIMAVPAAEPSGESSGSK